MALDDAAGIAAYKAMLLRLLVALAAFALLPGAAAAVTHTGAEEAALDAAVHAMCGKQIAMLGENGNHGDGRTMAFKAVLVERLVRQCGFGAVFFEASHYEFLEIGRRLRAGARVDDSMVASAIGGLWNGDVEMVPLIGFLAAEARAGRVTLGGLDDQLGARGAFFSLDTMPTELTARLPEPRRAACREALNRRIRYDYPEDAPASETTREALRRCLREMRVAAGGDPALNRADRIDRIEMIDAIGRTIARDFDDRRQGFAGRDRSMFIALRWLSARLPRRAKIIVWAENIHVAKDPGFDPDVAGEANFGALVNAAWHNRAFALGFSAASGSFRLSRRTLPIPDALPGSIEARALADGWADVAYVDRRRLAAAGAVPGGATLMHRVVPFDWSRAYDGLVVFRAERPPTPAGD